MTSGAPGAEPAARPPAEADLLGEVARLVDIPSVSHQESGLADHLEAELSSAPWLEVTRVGDNVVARTRLGRGVRVLLAGHLDTVPPRGNERSRRDGDVLSGVGSADMKGGLAVMSHLARTVEAPAVDVSYVFYVCEEVDQVHNGLLQLEAERPDLLECDVAVLGEPTAGRVEAGCQGTLRMTVTLGGHRAHTARPWMGRNAIHRLGPLLCAVEAYECRRPVIDGCEYREALQAVAVDGGVAGNVVPDRVGLTLNHRFAPDRTAEEAFAAVRAALAPHCDGSLGDALTLDASSAPAPPGLGHPVLAALVARTGRPPVAKLGWTDVSFFAARGVPATNFGPGEPTLAHTPEERLERSDLEAAHAVLRALITDGN